MSSDAWALAASQRQRRQWRHWPWGWIALVASIAAWACMAAMVFLVAASIGMPGDGDHAMQATRVPMLVTLLLAAVAITSCLIAGSLALRLARQSGAAIFALVLLSVLLLLSGLPLLGLMA
ncbi:hypothetical protein FHR62_001621 [Xanthomonas arboricola]|nr:hypothetical protein [Xanthomonas arboricola]